MKIIVTNIIRLADSGTFSPVERALVTAAGVRAMHRDGGYYVFVSSPPDGADVEISCAGYQPASVKPCGSCTVYLTPLTPTETAVQLFVSEYDADSRSLTVMSAGGELPAVLEQSVAELSGQSVRIVGYDRCTGVLTLEKALKKKPAKGQTLTITAG